MAEIGARTFRGGIRCVKARAPGASLPQSAHLMSRLRVFILLLLLGDAASALEIREKRWGFDGRVRVGRFNVLSFFVSNPDARNFDGQLVLENSNGLEKSTGAPVVQPVYLAPGTQRWVQFHVFVGQAGGDWRLNWGKGTRDSEKIDGAQAP